MTSNSSPNEDTLLPIKKKKEKREKKTERKDIKVKRIPFSAQKLLPHYVLHQKPCERKQKL